METVDEIAKAIVVHEGGFVDDPDDPGGPTNIGVTLKTLKHLGLDIDHDGDVDINDLKDLTIADAVALFMMHYYLKPKIDQLPYVLQATVFDMNVNAGSNSIRILQRLLKTLKLDPGAVDGIIGERTLTAAKVAAANGDLLRDAYSIERRNYYYRLADRRKASRKYARTRAGDKGGWIRRAEAFMSDRFHFSLAEHHRRTAQWQV